MTWDLTPGTRDVYAVREIEGQFDQSTGAIGLLWAGQFSPNRVAIWNLAVSGFPDMIPLIARVHVGEHDQMPTAPINPGSLYEVPWTLPSGVNYIGEMTGARVIQAPPIPVYRDNGPDAIQGGTVVQWYDPEQAPWVLPWTHFRGLDAAPWGADAERCGLWERDATGPQYAYNYVWREGRIVDQWWGVVEAGNQVRGTQYYRVA